MAQTQCCFSKTSTKLLLAYLYKSAKHAKCCLPCFHTDTSLYFKEKYLLLFCLARYSSPTQCTDFPLYSAQASLRVINGYAPPQSYAACCASIKVGILSQHGYLIAMPCIPTDQMQHRKGENNSCSGINSVSKALISQSCNAILKRLPFNLPILMWYLSLAASAVVKHKIMTTTYCFLFM